MTKILLKSKNAAGIVERCKSERKIQMEIKKNNQATPTQRPEISTAMSQSKEGRSTTIPISFLSFHRHHITVRRRILNMLGFPNDKEVPMEGGEKSDRSQRLD